MADKERILISCDKFKQKDIEEAVDNVVIPGLNKVVQNWNSLGIGDLETEYLEKALAEPRKFFEEVCLAHIPEEELESVGPFQKRKKKTLEGLELPDASGFIAAAEAIITPMAMYGGGVPISEYEIFEGEVRLKDREKLFDSRCRIFASSEKAKEYYSLQNKFIEAAKELNDFIKGNDAFGQSAFITSRGLAVDEFFSFGINEKNVNGPTGWINQRTIIASIKNKGYSQLNKL